MNSVAKKLDEWLTIAFYGKVDELRHIETDVVVVHIVQSVD